MIQTLDQPKIVAGQEAASRLIKDLTRASNIITRIGSLYKEGVPLLKWVNVNELIQEMIALLRSEAARYSISVHGACRWPSQDHGRPGWIAAGFDEPDG